MADVIDISVPLRNGMPTWPGGGGFALTRTKRLEAGDTANGSELSCDVHVGTHVDAPLHFLEDGAAVELLPLDVLVGRATVAFLPDANAISAGDLEGLSLAPDTRRLLLRTRNSDGWAKGATEFMRDFAALTPEAAHWVVDRGISLIGIDYLSVQRYNDSPLTHQILLEVGVVIVEGLNLSNVDPGEYELICLPLCLVGAEGAPARAVLRTLPPSGRARDISGGSS